MRHRRIQRWYAALAVVFAEPAIGRAQSIDVSPMLDWGYEVAQEIDATLKVPGTALYAETAHTNGSRSGGAGGYGFAWPLSTQFRVLNSLARYNPTRFAPTLRAFSDAFHNNFWSSQGGYSCCKGGGDRYYDDNAHIAVALMEAYEITHDATYLSRAQSTYSFLLTGEAPGYPGGSYWRVNDFSFLDSAAALQGARAGAMLYQATGNAAYLQDAQLRLTWANSTTQLSDGTFMEKLFLTGPQAGTIGNYPLVNFAGFGISANLELYDAAGNGSYLVEARRIATTSRSKYFSSSTGALNDEGYWAFEMVDAFANLYEHDHLARWISSLSSAMQWLHANKADPNGHYGVFFGREGPQVGTLENWSLNDQAAVAVSYLETALLQVPVVTPGSLGDFNADHAIDGRDFLNWQRSRGLTGQWDRRHGDGNLDGVVNATDLLIWNLQFGSSPAGVAGGTGVPEPDAAALGSIACAGLVYGRRRRHLSRIRRR